MRITSFMKQCSYPPRRWIELIFLPILCSVSTAVIPIFAAPVVDQASEGTLGFANVAMMAAVFIFQTVLTSIQSYRLGRIVLYWQTDLYRSMMNRLLRVKMDVFQHKSQSEWLSRVSVDVPVACTAADKVIAKTTGSVVLLLLGLVGMWMSDSLLSMIALSTILGGLGASLIFAKMLEKGNIKVLQRMEGINGVFSCVMSGMALIKVYGAYRNSEEMLVEEVEGLSRARKSILKTEAQLTPLASMLLQVGLVATMGVGVYRTSNNILTPGQLLAFFMYLTMLAGPFMQLTECAAQGAKAIAALQRIATVMALQQEEEMILTREGQFRAQLEGNFEESVKTRHTALSSNISFQNSLQNTSPHTSPHYYECSTKEPELEFDNVAYQYASCDDLIGPVSFKVQCGEVVGIVGPSGAGKSTLLRLAGRLYTPTMGVVRRTGQDAAEIPIRDYRNGIAFVEQDCRPLGTTIRDNLILGGGDIDDSVVELLSRFGFPADPNFIDRVLRNDGVGLSGGEMQRLAWIRAIIHGGTLGLLDEPTASVDGRNAIEFLNVVHEWRSSKAILMVTHRMNVARLCDRLVLMIDGKVQAVGSHEELLSTCREYNQLFTELSNQ